MTRWRFAAAKLARGPRDRSGAAIRPVAAAAVGGTGHPRATVRTVRRACVCGASMLGSRHFAQAERKPFVPRSKVKVTGSADLDVNGQQPSALR